MARAKLQQLMQTIGKYDAESVANRTRLLKEIGSLHTIPLSLIKTYNDALIFTIAYPSNAREWKLANSELSRIAKQLKAMPDKSKKTLKNSGLPFTHTKTHFSHDCLRVLTSDKNINVSIHQHEQSNADLNSLLKHTLPGILTYETTAGYSNSDLLDSLAVNPKHKLHFLIDQFDRLNHLPFLKDQLFQQLGLEIMIEPKRAQFSLAFNRLPTQDLFYHESLYKKFDHNQLFNQPIGKGKTLTEVERDSLIQVVTYAMAVNARETDPTTYMDKNSIKLFELDRGISIALYGMVAARQLPMESYVGYTLFKNGIPAAYGGAWLFGKRAQFGINIFEPLRGGESGYVLCQLLRTYIQLFGVREIEIEPYQYGLDNPEGIATGAFWFYYRFGFKPMDASLRKLAEQEAAKINKTSNYRSPNKTLMRFTESNMILALDDTTGKSLLEQLQPIKTLLKKKYQNLHTQASLTIKYQLAEKIAVSTDSAVFNDKAFEEFALYCAANNITDTKRLQKIPELIECKAKDVYRYQQLFIAFLET